LMLICHSCREQLNGSEFKYCPWCGLKFEDNHDR
jgi:rRNA maturation endonuclease Nob1